ncbi:hypothetical protein HFO24_06535 [Rhizobium laguerreae]|uniref:hypothetical protein n=1 Tax=Rhizobium laguerreae TaxID=1076926 RepID=UPI001C91CF55|nr:hypothetical protein [Rhizobium laguerreae]MBY3181326.1 hypothetical protein [Rhizobium laguerreae]
MTSQIVTREELYRMLWAEPATTVAARLGVSDRYLSQKVCPRLGVPAPPPGYWAKRAVGRAPPAPPLPERSPGIEQLWRRSDRPRQPLRPRTKPVAQRRHRKPCPGLHPLVREAAVHLVMIGTGNNGEYLKPRRKRLADLSVTCETLFRSLTFANALYQSLEGAGCRVMLALDTEELLRIDIGSDGGGDGNGERDLLRWAPVRPTVAYVYGVPIGLAVVEASEAVEMMYVGGGRHIRESEFDAKKHFGPTWKAELEKPSGRLTLTAYSPFHPFPWSRRWIETGGKPLAAQLPAILGAVEIAALDLATKLETVDWYFERES